MKLFGKVFFSFLILLLLCSTVKAEFPAVLKEFKLTQEKTLEAQFDAWRRYASEYQSANIPQAQFWEQPSVFFSPLAICGLLEYSNHILKRAERENRPLTENEGFAVWLASTQVLFTFNPIVIRMQELERKTSDQHLTDVQRATQLAKSNMQDYALAFAHSAQILPTEYDGTPRKPDFAGIASKLRTSQLGGDFFTLTHTGGSFTWKEPRIDSWERILELTQRSSDTVVRFLAISKLSWMAKYQTDDTRRYLLEQLKPIFLSTAFERSAAPSIKLMAVYTLRTLLPLTGYQSANQVPEIAAELRRTVHLRDDLRPNIAERWGIELLNEGESGKKMDAAHTAIHPIDVLRACRSFLTGATGDTPGPPPQ